MSRPCIELYLVQDRKFNTIILWASETEVNGCEKSLNVTREKLVGNWRIKPC